MAQNVGPKRTKNITPSDREKKTSGATAVAKISKLKPRQVGKWQPNGQ